ncbi:MAG: HTH domain-containing protein [Bacteroidota bacterium]
MKFLKQIKRLERVDQLIRLKATGTPRQLAIRLEVSERTIYDIITAMKDLGAPIYYSHQRRSYCYEFPVRFQCGVQFEQSQLGSVRGGIEKSLDFFSGLQIFCSKTLHICNRERNETVIN